MQIQGNSPTLRNSRNNYHRMERTPSLDVLVRVFGQICSSDSFGSVLWQNHPLNVHCFQATLCTAEVQADAREKREKGGGEGDPGAGGAGGDEEEAAGGAHEEDHRGGGGEGEEDTGEKGGGR